MSVQLILPGTIRPRPLAELEREEIIRALSFFGHNTAGKREAAAALGVTLKTLYNKLHHYGLSEEYRVQGPLARLGRSARSA